MNGPGLATFVFLLSRRDVVGTVLSRALYQVPLWPGATFVELERLALVTCESPVDFLTRSPIAMLSGALEDLP